MRQAGSRSASGADAGDFSYIGDGGGLVTSIDRVHRCAEDWGRFARIALNHAFGDVVCAGATPIQALLSFEFGLDASVADHAALLRGVRPRANCEGCLRWASVILHWVQA